MFEKLIKKYDGAGIEDDGAVKSREFVEFAKAFKMAFKDSALNLDTFSVGHYDVYGFAEYNGKECYFSYSVPRGGYPLDMKEKSPLNGILYRTAEGNSDFYGGPNHFTNFQNFEQDVKALLA